MRQTRKIIKEIRNADEKVPDTSGVVKKQIIMLRLLN